MHWPDASVATGCYQTARLGRDAIDSPTESERCREVLRWLIMRSDAGELPDEHNWVGVEMGMDAMMVVVT